MKKNGEISISFATCRRLYEHHVGYPLPSDMPYRDAAQLVLNALGPEKFRKLAISLSYEDEQPYNKNMPDFEQLFAEACEGWYQTC